MNERRMGKTPIKKICDTGRARPPPPAALYAITSDVAPKKRGRLARASLVTSHLIFQRSERCGRWCMRPAMGGLPWVDCHGWTAAPFSTACPLHSRVADRRHSVARPTRARSPLPQITAETLDALAGILEIGGLGRVGDTERRPEPERRALHHRDAFVLQ